MDMSYRPIAYKSEALESSLGNERDLEIFSSLVHLK